MRTPPDLDEVFRLPAAALNTASVQPVLSGTLAIEHESNSDILDAIDHAHHQLIAAEIGELVGIIRAADRWKIDPDAVGAGIERMIQPGHDGTPQVAEFLALELGALLGITPRSALARIGDALDLRNRHPQLWAAVLAGTIRVWQANRICFECSHLPYRSALRVDAALAASIGNLPWTRVMKALPGHIIAADPQIARDREQARRDSRRIRVSGIEDGHINLFGVVDPADGILFDHVLNEVATLFPAEPDQPLYTDHDRRRSLAFGIITRNAHTTFCSNQQQPDTPITDLTTNDPAPPTSHPGKPADSPRRHQPAHCTRIEDWGPLLTERLPEFLAGTKVTVRPIIDPADIQPIDCYETPARMRFALNQRNPVDVFPYATLNAASCDADHTLPYTDGRPGQTRLDNLGPLSRKTHRAKTHGKWKLEQPTPGVFHWTSPHGYHYTVTANGAIRTVVPEQAY